MKSLDKDKPKELEWEKEFDEKYQEVIGDLIDSAIDVGSKTDNNPLVIDLNPIRLLTPEFIEARTKLENFIQSLLTQQRTELLEEILEEIKKSMPVVPIEYKDGWDRCIDYVEQIIEDEIHFTDL